MFSLLEVLFLTGTSLSDGSAASDQGSNSRHTQIEAVYFLLQ